MYFEARHFLKTVVSHPHIWLCSLAVMGIVIGVGMWAITNEKDAYIEDRKQTAEFVARETATYFANEFKRAFLPLYSLREAVTHSGYFDDLAFKMGRYPANLLENDVPVEGGLANLRNIEGICDDEEVLAKWDELVSTSTTESDLDGLLVRYRLMPRNVACLEHKKNMAMVDSGMDMSNSNHPFWSMVVEDLFVKKWEGLHVFGPFMAGDMEVFCTHLGIWTKPGQDDEFNTFTEDGAFSLGNIQNSLTDIQGTEVAGVWGFIMNYLNWGEMKKRSNIYERFSNVGMDFKLNRLEEDVEKLQFGPKGAPTKNFGELAQSPNSHLLDDTNSIIIETESLHGIWQNRVGIPEGWEPEWWSGAVASVIIVAVLLSFLTALTLVKGQLHRTLVNNMLPPKAIQKITRGQTVIEKYNLATVFYADLVGFSGSKNSMTPVQVMNMLNDLYTQLDVIAKRHGVYKVETVGNRYMVVGGAPNQESARVAAKRVALFAIDATNYVDNIFLTTNGDKLYIRSGIASGSVVAGVVGTSSPHYTFFGDTIDYASRLEKTSKKMKIQVSEVTYRLLQDAPAIQFELSKTDGVEVKGKGNHVTWWLEKATSCKECQLVKGSFILDPCGHVLCAKCNSTHNLNVCPICRSKVKGRSEWTQDAPTKFLDIDDASFDIMETGEVDDSTASDSK